MRLGRGGLTVILLLSSMRPGASVADLADVEQGLERDIASSQSGLSELQDSIGRERGDLAQRINAAQNEVLDLRSKAVAARRAADEETLSLNQIEERLDSWQEQSRYQSRLLAGFLDRSGLRSLSDRQEFGLEQDLPLLSRYLSEQEARLNPDWQTEEVVEPEGQIEEASVLSLGPVHLFVQEGAQQSGLLERAKDMNRVQMLYDKSARDGVAALYREGSGTLTFDPTLSRALRLAEDKETLLEHLRKGGLWVIPILFFALFATVTALGKAVALYRLPALLPALAERVAAALKEGPAALASLQGQVRGAQHELLRIALLPQTAEQRDDRLYAALLEQRNRLERWLGAIAMTASVSPLLGLLGTVSGMIATFKLMTLFGAGDATSVSAGISEALVTTELGLVVAIPALLAHALMSRKVKNYFSRLEGDAIHLSQLHPTEAPR
jgi:biopolymer transport protein ExbB